MSLRSRVQHIGAPMGFSRCSCALSISRQPKVQLRFSSSTAQPGNKDTPQQGNLVTSMWDVSGNEYAARQRGLIALA